MQLVRRKGKVEVAAIQPAKRRPASQLFFFRNGLKDQSPAWDLGILLGARSGLLGHHGAPFRAFSGVSYWQRMSRGREEPSGS